MGTASYGISSPLGISGIVLLIIGVILLIVGVILLVVNTDPSKPWYIWALIFAGLVLSIIGGILLAVAYSSGPKTVVMTTMGEPAPVEVKCDACGQSIGMKCSQ
jgi:drug/metabolite transporter (DMT)-like permease